MCIYEGHSPGYSGVSVHSSGSVVVVRKWMAHPSSNGCPLLRNFGCALLMYFHRLYSSEQLKEEIMVVSVLSFRLTVSISEQEMVETLSSSLPVVAWDA